MLKPIAAAPLVAAGLLLAGPAPAEIDFATLPAIAQPRPARVALMDLTRAGERLVAVGERGVIAYSDDSGANWSQAAVPLSATLTAVSFADAQNGWAVGHGGAILHSSDGGANWLQQFDGRQANQQLLQYAQEQVGTLEQALDEADPDSEAGQDLEIAMEDAGYLVEDAQLAVETGPADPFLDILMLDTNRGFAVGAYGMLYTTSDGGEHWQISIGGIENPSRYHYYAIASGADNTLYLCGEAGLLYRSLDGGTHWEQLDQIYEGSLFGILTQGDAVLTFGLRGHIFRSEDRGETWTRIDSGVEQGLYGGTALPGGDIVLFGAGGQVLRSSDGGRSFSARNHPSRSTFSEGIAGGDGDYLIAGMRGVVSMQWEQRQ
ncbi:sialidase [Mangrovimicrobium sediminis]|uniref:Sialidase n=1 Tax=Mangrovimicrobium sediminis TaxID=2562682 RepID=A0A4Z0M9K1_9GAMM|nr:YCF48-related protein [Haliea sp. SAOS-164]TGD76066.1 sialidase [Haliea sp. SAOS-164]